MDAPSDPPMNLPQVHEQELSASSFSGDSSDEVDYQNHIRIKRANQAILENAEEGIYGLDGRGRVTFVNPMAQRLTGWTLEDLKGPAQHSRLHYSPVGTDDHPDSECPIFMAMLDREVYSREEVFWRKNGTSFQVALTSTPILREGHPAGAIVVFIDITDRVRARAWQRSRVSVLSSIMGLRPFRETYSHLIEALRVLVGVTKTRPVTR